MKKILLGMASLAAMAVGAGQAYAGTLTLTASGVNLGFSLSTFATLNPGYQNGFNFGPFGLASSGSNIVVSNYPNDTRYTFNDVDGQTTATALNTVSGSGSSTNGYGTLNGTAYGGSGGSFHVINSNGTLGAIIAPGYSPYLGVVGDNPRGTLIATSSSGLIEIDPGTNAVRIIANAFADGISVSPDGKTVYGEVGDHIIGYDIATGAQVFDSGFLSGGPDGTGVIVSTNSLNGDIVVNFNNGFVDLLDPTTKLLTTIADSGSRGDYVFADPNNGSLLLDYSEGVFRLTCGANCSFGPPPPPPVLPEPMSALLFGVGLLGLGAVRRRTIG